MSDPEKSCWVERKAKQMFLLQEPFHYSVQFWNGSRSDSTSHGERHRLQMPLSVVWEEVFSAALGLSWNSDNSNVIIPRKLLSIWVIFDLIIEDRRNFPWSMSVSILNIFVAIPLKVFGTDYLCKRHKHSSIHGSQVGSERSQFADHCPVWSHEISDFGFSILSFSAS